MIRISSSSIREAALSRPSNYLSRVESLSQSDGDYFYFTEENYRMLRLEFSPIETWPAWAKSIVLFRRQGDAGLGDTIHSNIPLANQIETILKADDINCGCADRRAWLNLRFPYKVD